LPHDDHVCVANAYKEAFFDLRRRPDHDEPLFPGAEATLRMLEEAGWLLGIATGKSQRGVRAMLDRHGLHGRFLTIQTADENPGKPHPGMLLAAMAETGAEPTGVVMIGDTAYDMQMARNARAIGVGVAWGYHCPDELRDCGARMVVDDYGALPSALDFVMKENGCVLAPS
jgi:phosphoglycolate phosphatase